MILITIYYSKFSLLSTHDVI